jgi:ATP-dependent Zn protease
MSLGATYMLPSEDRVSITHERAENMIACIMGGRLAEE